MHLEDLVSVLVEDTRTGSCNFENCSLQGCVDDAGHSEVLCTGNPQVAGQSNSATWVSGINSGHFPGVVGKFQDLQFWTQTRFVALFSKKSAS